MPKRERRGRNDQTHETGPCKGMKEFEVYTKTRTIENINLSMVTWTVLWDGPRTDPKNWHYKRLIHIRQKWFKTAQGGQTTRESFIAYVVPHLCNTNKLRMNHLWKVILRKVTQKLLFVLNFDRRLLQSNTCVPGYKIMERFLGFIVTTATIIIIQYSKNPQLRTYIFRS